MKITHRKLRSMIKEYAGNDQENKRELDAWKEAHPDSPIADFPYYSEEEWGKEYIASLEKMEESMKITHAQLSQIIKEELEYTIKETREDNSSEKNLGSKFDAAKNKSSLSQIDYISKELQKTVDWFEEVVFPAIEDNKFPIVVDSRYMFDVDGLGLSSSEDRRDDGIDTAWRLRGNQGMRSIDKLVSIQGFENAAYPEAVQRHKSGRMSIGDIYGRLESLVIDNPKLKVRMTSDAGKVIDNIAESKRIKVTQGKLRSIIKEELAHVVFDDVHVVPDDLESLDPHDAYGLGHEAGAEHEDTGPDLDNDGVLGVGEIVRMVHKMVNDLSPEAATVEDAWYPSDVTARKDAWPSGDNLDEPRDYTRFATGESNAGPHVTTRECSEAVEMPQFWSRILGGCLDK